MDSFGNFPIALRFLRRSLGSFKKGTVVPTAKAS